MDTVGFLALGIGGFTIGIIVGMALRLLARVGLYVVGIYIASLIVLASLGVIVINWSALQGLIYKAVDFLVNLTHSDVVTSTGAFGATFSLGAIYGLIKGTVSETNQYRFFRRIK